MYDLCICCFLFAILIAFRLHCVLKLRKGFTWDSPLLTYMSLISAVSNSKIGAKTPGVMFGDLQVVERCLRLDTGTAYIPKK